MLRLAQSPARSASSLSLSHLRGRLFPPGQAIKRAVEKKSAEVFTSLTLELSLVKKGFDKQKAAPPLIHRDHPRYAGAALWAKSLHLRVTRQWAMLEASSKTAEDLVAKTAEAKQVSAHTGKSPHASL